MIDVIETVYRGASKGRGLVVAPKGMLSDSEGSELTIQITRHATSIRFHPSSPDLPSCVSRLSSGFPRSHGPQHRMCILIVCTMHLYASNG
jgi:hypothetical protein